MRLDDYQERDGKRVWLRLAGDDNELDMLLEKAKSPQQRVAMMLGGKSGLRRAEIVSVTPNDFQHAPDGFVRVWNDYAKKGKYREAPVPDELATIVETLSYSQDPDEPVVDVTGKTVYRWVINAARELRKQTNDQGWSYLDVHDLRRSWGGHLLWNCGVSPMVVMEFGGWSDWETFSEHYMGEITPEAQERERAKIDYMGGDPSDEVIFEPDLPGAKAAFGGQSR